MKRMKLGAKLGACVAALSLVGATAAQAQARRGNCATPTEISAVQISAVQQELTDAALACGPVAVANFNRFQTIFGKELRTSDAVMLRMFKRLHGNARGNREYDAYKTRAIANADLRRTKPGQHDNFCRSANIVFDAALAPDKPVLEDFVSGVPVNEPTPVNGCEITVAVTFQGVQAGPEIVPLPRPTLAGDPPTPVY